MVHRALRSCIAIIACMLSTSGMCSAASGVAFAVVSGGCGGLPAAYAGDFSDGYNVPGGDQRVTYNVKFGPDTQFFTSMDVSNTNHRFEVTGNVLVGNVNGAGFIAFQLPRWHPGADSDLYEIEEVVSSSVVCDAQEGVDSTQVTSLAVKVDNYPLNLTRVPVEPLAGRLG